MYMQSLYTVKKTLMNYREKMDETNYANVQSTINIKLFKGTVSKV